VSRAGLSSQAADLEELILKNWDKQSRLSRAGLRRDLQVLLNFSEENWAKVGQKTPSVTRHPISATD
jgi:hypothetical protein